MAEKNIPDFYTWAEQQGLDIDIIEDNPDLEKYFRRQYNTAFNLKSPEDYDLDIDEPNDDFQHEEEPLGYHFVCYYEDDDSPGDQSGDAETLEDAIKMCKGYIDKYNYDNAEIFGPNDDTVATFYEGEWNTDYNADINDMDLEEVEEINPNISLCKDNYTGKYYIVDNTNQEILGSGTTSLEKAKQMADDAKEYLSFDESLNETLSGLKSKKKLDILKELKKDPNYKEDPRWKEFEDELINFYRVDPSEADIDTAIYYTETDWIDSLHQMESLDEAVKPFVDDNVIGLINKYEYHRLPAEYNAVYIDKATRVDQLGTSSSYDPHDVIRAQVTYDTPWGEEFAEKTYRVYDDGKVEEIDESLTEDTVKQNGKWVNKGKEGTHGKFKTKKAADDQRKAMFRNGYHESLDEAKGKKYRVTGTLRNIWYDDDGNEVDREEWEETHTYTINSDDLPPEDLAKVKFEDGVTRYWNKRVRHDDGSEFEVEVTSVKPLDESLDEAIKPLSNYSSYKLAKLLTDKYYDLTMGRDDKTPFLNWFDRNFGANNREQAADIISNFDTSKEKRINRDDLFYVMKYVDRVANLLKSSNVAKSLDESKEDDYKRIKFLKDELGYFAYSAARNTLSDEEKELKKKYENELRSLGKKYDLDVHWYVRDSLDEDINDIYYVVQFDNNDFMKIYPGVKGIYHSPLNGATLFDSEEKANDVCNYKQDHIRRERLTPHIIKVRSLGIDKNEIVKESLIEAAPRKTVKVEPVYNGEHDEPTYFSNIKDAYKFANQLIENDREIGLDRIYILYNYTEGYINCWVNDKRGWRNPESIPALESLDEAKNDTLNPAIWEDEELKPEVKEKLQFIADKFIEKLKEDDIPLDVDDIVIVGSNANYNYGPQSDIDLHIIADLSQFKGREKELAEKIYQRKKSIFNDKYDPTINGFEVEIYVEPSEDKDNNDIPDEVEEPLEEQLRKPSKEEIEEMLDMINGFDEEISGFELGDFARKFNLENVEAAEKVIDCIKGGSDTLDNGEPWWSLIRDDTEDDLLFPDEDMEEVAFCPNCDGEQLYFLGYQGNVEEFKCPICGGYFYRKPGSDELTSEWEVEVYND